MVTEKGFSETLELIYDAGLDFARWPAVLGKLAEMSGASMTCLVRHDAATSEGAMVTVRAEPDTARLYAERYAKLNVFAQRAGRRPAQTCMTDRSVLPKQELFGTEFYADFLRPRDVHSILSVYLLREGATRVALGRPHRAGEWDQEHIDRLRLFASHLHRAAEINVRLEGSRLGEAGAIEALDGMAQGVIVVDADGRPVFLNGAADQTLAEVDGLGIDGRGLCAAHRTENATLRRMIAVAANERSERPEAGVVSVSRPSMRPPLSLMVAPLRKRSGWFLPQQSGAIIFVRDPERVRPVADAHVGGAHRLNATAALVRSDEVRSSSIGDVAPASQMRPPPSAYAFGPFCLDAERYLLFRGGEPVALGMRAAALLRALVERPGMPVLKNELIEAAWSGLTVQDSNLTVQIAALRRVLGRAGGATWIETFPRRGYRYVGPPVTTKGGNVVRGIERPISQPDP